MLNPVCSLSSRYVDVPTVSLLGDGVWERDYLCGDVVLSYLGEFS